MRSVLKEMIEEELNEKPSVKISEISKRIVERVRTDPTLLEQVLDQTLGRLIYLMALDILHKKRRPTKETDDSHSDVRFASWYEWTGEEHVKLMALNRSTASAAIAVRLQRIENENRIVEFIDHLRAGLKSNKQTFAQRWGLEGIAEAYDRFVLEK
jgi:hypothetical protein